MLKSVVFISAPLLAMFMPASVQAQSAAPSAPASETTVASNSEMSAIFKADQDARKAEDIDWPTVAREDLARRKRTKELLDAGQLNSAEDYYHAAFVFQHGDDASSYLTAHTLAVIAVAKGKDRAAWIAAASLDRYLMNIGQPQIYGTQYSRREGGEWTQEPYNRELISDALRRASGVPTLAEQQERLAKMAAASAGQ